MRSLEFGLDKKWYLTVDLEQREKLRRMNNTRVGNLNSFFGNENRELKR